ncbi:MAG: response regulator [Gammaproteobacteria bacterium]
MKDKKYLTPTEVADLLLVSPITVRQWAQKGLLEARTTVGGHRRFSIDSVRRFAREMGRSGNLGEDDGRRILVVDDERSINKFLVDLLEERGGDVVVDSAFDGFEAGRKVATFRPDIVLLDIMMPGLGGIEVCRRLKSSVETMQIHVVAMTGFSDPELASKVLAAGADRFLRKPFKNDDVLEACGLLEITAA